MNPEWVAKTEDRTVKDLYKEILNTIEVYKIPPSDCKVLVNRTKIKGGVRYIVYVYDCTQDTQQRIMSRTLLPSRVVDYFGTTKPINTERINRIFAKELKTQLPKNLLEKHTQQKIYGYFRFSTRFRTSISLEEWFNHFKKKGVPVAICKHNSLYSLWVIGEEYSIRPPNNEPCKGKIVKSALGFELWKYAISGEVSDENQM